MKRLPAKLVLMLTVFGVACASRQEPDQAARRKYLATHYVLKESISGEPARILRQSRLSIMSVGGSGDQCAQALDPMISKASAALGKLDQAVAGAASTLSGSASADAMGAALLTAAGVAIALENDRTSQDKPITPPPLTGVVGTPTLTTPGTPPSTSPWPDQVAGFPGTTHDTVRPGTGDPKQGGGATREADPIRGGGAPSGGSGTDPIHGGIAGGSGTDPIKGTVGSNGGNDQISVGLNAKHASGDREGVMSAARTPSAVATDGGGFQPSSISGEAEQRINPVFYPRGIDMAAGSTEVAREFGPSLFRIAGMTYNTYCRRKNLPCE